MWPPLASQIIFTLLIDLYSSFCSIGEPIHLISMVIFQDLFYTLYPSNNPLNEITLVDVRTTGKWVSVDILRFWNLLVMTFNSQIFSVWIPHVCSHSLQVAPPCSKDCFCTCWNCYYCRLANEMHHRRDPPTYVYHVEKYCDGRYLQLQELLIIMNLTFDDSEQPSTLS